MEERMTSKSKPKSEIASAIPLSTYTPDEFEQLLLSRNWGLISPEVQTRLRDQVILAAGVGLCSEMVVQACRLGFRNFILADGDTVEVSNLNRQAFTHAQIGLNKAKATSKLLRSLVPSVRVQVIPKFLNEKLYRPLLSKATLVINSIDFNNPSLFTLNRDACALDIPVLCPLNLGWGSVVLVFTAASPSLESFLGLDSAAPLLSQEQSNGAEHVDVLPFPLTDVLDRLIAQVYAHVPGGVPDYLAELASRYPRRTAADGWSVDPQLGPTTAVTAAMLVRAAVAIVAGEPVRVVPDINFTDLRQVMS
jgi:hypothetical protein